jgi:hypothetical protein
MTYPLGIDNPIKIKAVMGSHKWALYWKDDFTKIATFPNEFVAMECRRSIIDVADDLSKIVKQMREEADS